MSTPSLLSRFQGCLVGAVVGDCLGANFEVYGVPRRNTIQKIFDFVRKALPGADSDDNTRMFHYTDDTAMARSVADCLIANNGKIDAEDLAKRFGIEFKAAPNRGYGPNVMTVLRAFSADDLSDVFEPARQQFGGDGSYGNGGAMRVAPVALPHQPNKIDEIIQVARTSALLTHANKLGYNGAILQACAVHFALHTDHDTFDCEEYISKLLGIMERIENVGGGDGLIEGVEEDSSSASKRVKKNETNEPSEGNSDRLKTKDEAVYCERLNTMKKFLKEEPSLKQVAEELGNKISAHFSVGSAVYSFLRGLSPIDEIPATNPVERTIVFAISLGGDTDTIASMAGAIAGAYHGIESIPTEWIKVCEGTDYALQQAKDLFDIYESMSGSK